MGEQRQSARALVGSRSSAKQLKAKLAHRAGSLLEAMEGRLLLSALPPTQPVGEQQVNFAVGASVADTGRNVVYLIDTTHQRVLAINTDTGNLQAFAPLAAPGVGIAVALTDDKLYVSEPSKTQLEVFSLSNLTSTGTITTGVAVNAITSGAADRIYGVTAAKQVAQLNGTTGALVSTIATVFTGVPIVRTNFAETHLYILDTGVTGSGNLPEYDITAGTAPTLVRNLTALLTGAKSLAVDEPSNHVYVSNTGVDGVGVINISANTESTWNFGGATSGVGVAALQGIQYVYGASSGPSFATIRQFDDNTGGTPVADYLLDNYSSLKTALTTDPDSLRMTPNGHVFFTANAAAAPNGEIGIIGVSSISVNRPVASFTVTNTGGRGYTFNGLASSPPTGQSITSWAWDFGDGTTGVGPTVFHTFAANGSYKVTLTVTASGGLTDFTSQTVNAFAGVTTPTPTPTTGNGVIVGTVYSDANKNRVQDANENGLRGVGVFIDTNHDGVYRKGEPFTSTGLHGQYAFFGLKLGSYAVTIIPLAGSTQTTPKKSSGQVVSVAADGEVDGVDFGLFTPVTKHRGHSSSVAAAVAVVTPKAATAASVSSWLSSTYTLSGVKKQVLD